MPGPEMEPNPAYEALKKLKNDVGLDADTVGEELKTPTADFSGVWWGTQADAFSAELEGRDGTLRTAAGNLEGDVQDKMNSTPAELAVEE